MWTREALSKIFTSTSGVFCGRCASGSKHFSNSTFSSSHIMLVTDKVGDQEGFVFMLEEDVYISISGLATNVYVRIHL